MRTTFLMDISVQRRGSLMVRHSGRQYASCDSQLPRGSAMRDVRRVGFIILVFWQQVCFAYCEKSYNNAESCRRACGDYLRECMSTGCWESRVAAKRCGFSKQ
jgi:hypothetical protein